MPRSAADATRFTATRPHAYSKPTSTPAARLRPQNSTARSTTIDPPPSASSSSAASTIDIPDPASATETPQQKVARLRAAAARARAAQESTFDRVLSRGRVWADRAHRVTVMGFVGLSVCCTGLALYATVDMMLYNRRKRRVFLAEQQANYEVALQKAYAAEAEGRLTPDLALVLNKERAVQEWERERAERKGVMQQAKEWAFGGMAKGEQPGGAMGLAGEEVRRIIEAKDEDGLGEGIGYDAGGAAKVLASREEAEKLGGDLGRRKHGGMLDELGERCAGDARNASRSLWDWITQR